MKNKNPENSNNALIVSFEENKYWWLTKATYHKHLLKLYIIYIRKTRRLLCCKHRVFILTFGQIFRLISDKINNKHSLTNKYTTQFAHDS